MLLTIVFGVLNLLLSTLGFRLLRLPGCDLTPAGVIILSSRGENIILAAFILPICAVIGSPQELKYLWLTIPATMLVGFLSLVFPSPVALVILYHLVCGAFAYGFGFLGGRYLLFVIINVALNITLGHGYFTFNT